MSKIYPCICHTLVVYNEHRDDWEYEEHKGPPQDCQHPSCIDYRAYKKKYNITDNGQLYCPFDMNRPYRDEYCNECVKSRPQRLPYLDPEKYIIPEKCEYAVEHLVLNQVPTEELKI